MLFGCEIFAADQYFEGIGFHETRSCSNRDSAYLGGEQVFV